MLTYHQYGPVASVWEKCYMRCFSHPPLDLAWKLLIKKCSNLPGATELDMKCFVTGPFWVEFTSYRGSPLTHYRLVMRKQRPCYGKTHANVLCCWWMLWTLYHHICSLITIWLLHTEILYLHSVPPPPPPMTSDLDKILTRIAWSYIWKWLACGGLPFPGIVCSVLDVANIFLLWNYCCMVHFSTFTRLSRMFVSTDFPFEKQTDQVTMVLLFIRSTYQTKDNQRVFRD